MYKKRSMLSTVVVLIAAAALWWFTGGGGPVGDAPKGDGPAIVEDGTYTTKEDVAAYLHTYGELPGNFITKDEARAVWWQGGGLKDIAPDSAIGGDRFGNFEGLLPDKRGRTWQEADIGSFAKASRGPERIVFSNDGLIYNTPDHNESFVEMKEGR